MSEFRTLIWAERKKLKRQRIIWVGYLSVIFSFVVTIVQQLQINNNSMVWSNLVDMFLYNNAVLFFPFPVTLIGGHMIEREYAQDTLKNLLVISVRWEDLIKAKGVNLFIWVIQVGIFEVVLSLLTGVLLRTKGITWLLIFRVFYQILLSNVCITIGILPVILWFGSAEGKYIWGSFYSMLIGVSGIFFINGKLVNWHPATASLSFTTETYKATNISTLVESVMALIGYCLVSIVVYYAIIYRRKKQME